MDTEILLVRDNSSDAELRLCALRTNNLANQIQLVRDGEEALDTLFFRGAHSNRRWDEVPRLVLLDLRRPKIDEIEVLQAVKSDRRTPAITVVVLLSSKEERDLVSSYKLGANSWVQKQVRFADFQDVLHQFGMFSLLINSASPALAATST